MSNALYMIATFLVIIWGIGFLGFEAQGFFHLLLVVALIIVIFRLFAGRRSV